MLHKARRGSIPSLGPLISTIVTIPPPFSLRSSACTEAQCKVGIGAFPVPGEECLSISAGHRKKNEALLLPVPILSYGEVTSAVKCASLSDSLSWGSPCFSLHWHSWNCPCRLGWNQGNVEKGRCTTNEGPTGRGVPITPSYHSSPLKLPKR